MPELVEQMFCSQQIVIPPKFPYILKRYCKAAIKTQPYDLLRWSYEYFKALSQHRPPPVKLRLEYPVYSTEGGLTRGCLKVLAHQLAGMVQVPLAAVKAVWGGFCLDPNELKRILCLCEVYQREETVPYLHFIAVAGGLLTKSLTHTMILLCESLTKEPDGGSAAIPVKDFLVMYKFLASIDASVDFKYMNGYREGTEPVVEVKEEEEKQEENPEHSDESVSDDYWSDTDELQKLALINAHVARSTRLSTRMTPEALSKVMGKIERSPSMERAGQIERENYQKQSRGRPSRDEGVDRKLREMSVARLPSNEERTTKIGEPEYLEEDWNDIEEAENIFLRPSQEETKEPKPVVLSETERVAAWMAEIEKTRQERIEDLQRTFEELGAIVDRFYTANYDLGMVAGRQMSTTSGEFIVQHIEKEIRDYIDDQIAILPDPDLKKKKAKPEEVAMIRDLLEAYLSENMDVIVPEIEEVEEEETPITEIIIVYAVPGIGPPVDEEIIREFVEYAVDVCKVQADVFMPRNVRHFLCPPMEKYVEHDYEHIDTKKTTNTEEVPTGGAITD